MKQLPNPWQLAESPELSVLHVLDAAISATSAALIAAFPELEDADFDGEQPPTLSTQAHLADAVLTHLNGLQAALLRYLVVTQRHYRSQIIPINSDF
jgi:hypothetical protein